MFSLLLISFLPNVPRVVFVPQTINSLNTLNLLQTYTYESAYHNGFRTCTSREFAVKPCQQIVEAFSCNLKFQQEEHPPEHAIYLRPVFTPREVR